MQRLRKDVKVKISLRNKFRFFIFSFSHLDPCKSNPCAEGCVALSATKFSCLSTHKPCYLDGQRYKHGENNTKLKCHDGHIEFIDGSCLLPDRTVIGHGIRRQMEDGITRRCDENKMKPEKCE